MDRAAVRRAAASVFVAFHVAAMIWWVFGRAGLPRGEAGAAEPVMGPVRAAGRTVFDMVTGSGIDRALMDRYMLYSGTWQSWNMFAPDVTRQRGELALHGIVALDREGRPVVDPEPFHQETREEWLQRNSHPPCGWGMLGTPRDRVLGGLFVRYQLERAGARAASYIGARYVCRLTPLPPSTAGAEVSGAQEWILWEGPR